jgi:hypothetical protein
MSNGDSEDKRFSEHKCGECARFKVPDSNCPSYDSFLEYVDGRPLMDGKSAACSDFYAVRKSKKEDKERTPHKASGLAEEGFYEAVYHNRKPVFLVKTSEDFKTFETVTNEGKPVAPKEWPSEFPYEPYSVYEGAIPNREELFWKVREEFDLFLDVESIYKDFLAACVLLSYQQEKVKTVPYVYFYGDNESGKTVALTLLSLLCYRPMFAVTIPPADLYGYLDDSDAPGTILEDEIQGLHRDMDKSKIYKAGYKQGAVVPRTMITQHKRFIRYFRCFCFKVCAAEEMPRVKGLLERFIFIAMVEGFPRKDWADVNGEDLLRIRKLRNMLLKWRLASHEWELPEVDLPVKGRLKELWKPIIQIVQGLTVEKDLRGFLERLQQERLNERINTLEGHIVKVVVGLYEKDRPLHFNTIWDELQDDLEGKVDEKKPNKMDTPEFAEVTKQKVGYRLREILGGKRKTIRDPQGCVKAYEFDEMILKRIAKKYGYEVVTKLPSFPTSRGISTQENTRKVHENNVEGMGKSPEKLVETPQKLGKLGNSVTGPSSNETAPTMKIEDKAILETEAPTVKNDVKPSLDTVQLEDLKSLSWDPKIESLDFHNCGVCGYRKQTSWKAETFKGNELWICEDCKQEWEKKREVPS